jgi:hypothetical protein
MLVEMPVPTTTAIFTTTAMTAPTKHPQAATATITHKSSRASLQLTHELGGYIRRMRSHAPTKNMKNTINTMIILLSLSATPRLQIRAPFDDEMIFRKHKMTEHH